MIVRLTATPPRLLVNGQMVFYVQAQEDGRTVQGLPVYVPPLDFPATVDQAVDRVYRYVEWGKAEVMRAYMATARGLNP